MDTQSVRGFKELRWDSIDLLTITVRNEFYGKINLVYKCTCLYLLATWFATKLVVTFLLLVSILI